MNNRALEFAALVFAISTMAGARAELAQCVASSQQHAIAIVQKDRANQGNWLTRLQHVDSNATEFAIEVYGENNYYQTLDNGWIFSLLRQPKGWVLRLYDKDPAAGGVDMSSITPPLSGSQPNTRELFGWHFRNANNTAPNTGDVNAPQHFRPFAFSRALIGTAGIKPSKSPSETRLSIPDDDGRGWLQMIDYGLAELAPGEKARMNYLKFKACVLWPKTSQEISDARFMTELPYIDEEIESFGQCGLDLKRYEVKARVAPRLLSGDLDGDGSIDELVQIRDRDTDRYDIALCRAGTWQYILSDVGDDDVFQHTLSALERWRLVPDNFAPANAHGGETSWPQAQGDVLVLERIEKSMFLVYMHNDQLALRKVFHFVEP